MLGIDVYFDPVCPWCYIGKARLDRAISKLSSGAVSLNWRPFLLNPDIPAAGVDRQTYLNWKFGSQDSAQAAYSPVVSAAEAEELEFNPERISRTPSTLDAHRLLLWAAVEGFEVAELIDKMFLGYLCQGLDVSESSVLISIAVECGMDKALVQRLLDSEQDKDVVLASSNDARSRGIDSIPSFIVNNSYAVHGAQPTEVWLSILGQELAGQQPG